MYFIVFGYSPVTYSMYHLVSYCIVPYCVVSHCTVLCYISFLEYALYCIVFLLCCVSPVFHGVVFIALYVSNVTLWCLSYVSRIACMALRCVFCIVFRIVGTVLFFVSYLLYFVLRCLYCIVRIVYCIVFSASNFLYCMFCMVFLVCIAPCWTVSIAPYVF